MKKLICNVMILVAMGGITALAATNPAKATAPVEQLTLKMALEMADSLQPQIAEAKAILEAAEGRAWQAGALPNPEAIVGAQQLGGAHSEEYVAGVAQAIPLGKRLSKARQAELLDREVRARGLEVKRREIRRRVHGAFATALYQERAYEAQKEIQQQAARTAAITQARVAAGDAVKAELARVEMELAQVQVELRRAGSLREQAFVVLASAMGDATLAVKSLAGSMDATLEIPTLESLVATLAAQPESALADADVRARMARVEAAKAERIPDVKVELLYHRLESSRENTVDVGLSIPLPLFNRNQGRLKEARAEQAAAEARARMTQNELSMRLQEAYLQLASALASSRTLKTEILGKADTVLKTAETRYAAGDISLTELLPVRRDWAAVQLSYLESLRDVMQAWAALSPYVGKP